MITHTEKFNWDYDLKIEKVCKKFVLYVDVKLDLAWRRPQQLSSVWNWGSEKKNEKKYVDKEQNKSWSIRNVKWRKDIAGNITYYNKETCTQIRIFDFFYFSYYYWTTS